MGIYLRKLVLILFVCLIMQTSLAYGEFKRDPVKETQTDPVAVTQELLNRESESGPASPSFKMSDTTSGFFAKKPYDHILKQELFGDDSDQETGLLNDDWEDWFEAGREEAKSTEALDKKELK